jgi:hypothetical protein
MQIRSHLGLCWASPLDALQACSRFSLQTLPVDMQAPKRIKGAALGRLPSSDDLWGNVEASQCRWCRCNRMHEAVGFHQSIPSSTDSEFTGVGWRSAACAFSLIA